jgi:hypothetical protein
VTTATRAPARWVETRDMSNRRALAVLAACLVSLSSAPALAGDGTLALGITGGTLGVGPELSLRPFEKLGVRAGVNWLGFSIGKRVNDIHYDGDLGLLSLGAMADWYPFEGGLRISAGARWNGNDLKLSARPTHDVTIGSVTYTPAELGRLTGTVDANAFAPVLTVGWGGDLSPGFTLGVELGFMYQGAPRIKNLRAQGGLLEGSAGLLSDLRDEEGRIEKAVEGYRYLPVLQAMLLYRF